MKYRLIYTRRAVKDINRLDQNIKKRIGKSLKRFEKAPLDYAEKLTDSRLGSYRFRIGDYRVIFDLEDQDIVVLRIGDRKEIYRKS